MDLRNCFNILELPPHASLEEVRQAYKDLANVWHPDRFAHNPRLRDRAEKKLQDINAAYEILTAQLNHRKKIESGQNDLRQASKSPSNEGDTAATDQQSHRPSIKKPSRDQTELIVELGTRALLTACYSLYQTLHHAVSDLAAKAEREAGIQEQRNTGSRSSQNTRKY